MERNLISTALQSGTYVAAAAAKIARSHPMPDGDGKAARNRQPSIDLLALWPAGVVSVAGEKDK